MDLKSFAYGLAAHLILGWALLFFLPPKTDRPKPPPIPVKITFEEKPVVIKQPETSSEGPRPHESRPTPTPAEPPKTAQKPTPVYTDLIPKATTGQISLPSVATAPTEVPLVEGHQFKEGSSGSTKQKLVIDASTLSAALDVPLKARRNSAGMEAFLRVERRSPNGLRIIDLRGDPMLRAVIFENLQEPKVMRLILQLMDELEENSLPITLQAIPGAADRMQDELDFSWIGRRLVIRKSAPPQSRGPGITLPDEDAKKAIIRDRLEFERYQRSPAYRSALQNYDVPTPALPSVLP